MKKFLLISLLSMAFVGASHAQAHGPYRMGGWHGGCYGCGWVAPLIIGGAIGYEINRANQPVIIQQPPVIIQQPQTYGELPPVGYHWQEMIDPQSGVRKIVAVPN